ncbi:hypothetical protein DPEC_G00340900 [Dallia pectoralis]|uniref:Uncharacterized protein n=1 Tax=Dallia pectoralis TaxID=75939 RepID=A0ACC2F5D1_DALPE|nr:hypothetical protein DPEC_G00340900 [Dallia pectoralis]
MRMSFNPFGCVISIVIFMRLVLCESSFHTAVFSSPVGGSTVLRNDSIHFDHVPDIVMDGSVVRIRYKCSRTCEVGVEVVVFSMRNRTEVSVFHKRWTDHRHPHVSRTLPVKLKFPQNMPHKEDRISKHFHTTTIQAWLHHTEQGKRDGRHANETSSFHGSLARTFKVLQAVLPSQCPARPSSLCPSWMADLRWQLSRDTLYQCPHESDTVDVLTFPMVSTGEGFGVIRKIQPFVNRGLEQARLPTVEKPRMTVSVWVYLVKWCDKSLCGIIHHIDQNSKYDTPLIQLTNTGDVIIQVRLTSGGDQAFRAHTAMPLFTWIRLDCFIQHSKVTLKVTPAAKTGGATERVHIFKFQTDIHYNDTAGYFVIGGSRFMPGIHGIFGPIRYNRLRAEKVNNPLSPAMLETLDMTMRQCDEIRAFTMTFLQALRESHEASMTGFCHSRYVGLWRRFGRNTCGQAWTWDVQRKHGTLFSFLMTQENFATRTWNKTNLLELGSSMFEDVVRILSNRGSTAMATTTTSSSLEELLQASSCYGHHHASLLLSTIHLAGLTGHVTQQQGHVYGLIGALGDDRLALMHLGYKHTQGIDGFPKDFDMAYCYYSNVGAQTCIDQVQILEHKQHVIEHIRVSNEDQLNSLTHESGDTFQFLKLQADRGDVESQKHLAKLLFWGQNGASRDVVSAIKWYAKSALEMEDPTAMYDLAILLLKGQGVKKNRTLGLQLMDKAAAKGSIPALNALGWYHSTVRKDYKKAFVLFEQAAHKGSHDGLFNLGLFHLNGRNPNNPEKNETAAFHLFLNSSLRGHVNGAVETAWYLSTGLLKGVVRDTERAVIMLKQICEQNGYLGYVVREALQAFLQDSWGEALLRYALAAETGLGVAQNNVAYLCEEMKQSFDCHWRYYNHSTLNYGPHDSGLLKMGDFYYSSSVPGAVDQALSLYTRAALAGSSQGIYQLVIMAEEGYEVPSIIRRWINVSVHDGLDVVVERLLERCVETNGKDLTPCALSLLRVRVGKAWRTMTQHAIQLSLVYASAGTLIIALITFLILNALECLQMDIPPIRETRTAGSAADNHRASNRNGRQDQNDPTRGEDRTSRTLTVSQGLWFNLRRGKEIARKMSELTVTVSGVCLCALCTLILHHLL